MITLFQKFSLLHELQELNKTTTKNLEDKLYSPPRTIMLKMATPMA